MLHAGPRVSVPLLPRPLASAAVTVAGVVAPSFRLQRPIRFGAEVNSRNRSAWISATLRATFQTRTSSNRPWKNPARAPVEFSMLPKPKCWMLVNSGVAPGLTVHAPPLHDEQAVSIVNSAPSRRSFHDVPSYVAAA